MMSREPSTISGGTAKMTMEPPHDIKTFLEQHRAYPISTPTDKPHYTHTSLKAGSYFIREMEQEYFFNLYYEALFVKGIQLHLTEGIRDRQYTPWRLDIDFRWVAQSTARIYKEEDITGILMNTMKIMEDIFAGLEPNERVCYVMEKPAPVQDDKRPQVNGIYHMKDGIHIMMPYITGHSAVWLDIREKLMKACDADIRRHPFSNSIADIFDISVLKHNNWVMYGSCKPDQPPYRVTRAYYVYTDRVEPAPIPPNNDLIRILSVRNKDIYTLFKTDKEEYYNKEIERQSTHRKHNIGRVANENTQRASAPRRKKFVDKNELEMARKCIALLSAERAQDRNSWRAVGLAAHHIGGEDLFADWVAFSRKPQAFNNEPEDTYRAEWATFTDACSNPLGLPSLKMWANQDDPVGYRDIKKDDIFSIIMEAAKSSKIPEYDVAKIVYKMYEGDYIYNDNQRAWYTFIADKHRWIEDTVGYYLRRNFSTEVYDKLKRAQQYLASQQDAGDATDNNRNYAKSIGDVMHRMKQTAFKENVMKECRELFTDCDNRFLNRLDINTSLICFNNGVYDLVLKEFRDGRPEDYITHNTGIDYIDYDENSPDVCELWTFLRQIMPISSVRERTLVFMSTLLNGSVKNETFEVWSGSGGNGKSKLTELIEKALGNDDNGYAYKLPVSFLTNKRGASNAAAPELVGLKGKRFASLQEPGEGARINAGLMKEMTGGDRLTGRALFKMPINFKPEFKLVLMCNDKPSLPPHDEGVWRRVRVTEFPAKFCDDPIITNPFQFVKDTNLNEKLDRWAPHFMALLIKYNNEFMGRLPRCREIERYIKEYRNKNEPFAEFYNECIAPAGDKDNTGISLAEIHRVYVNWFRAENGLLETPKKQKELAEFLLRQLGSSSVKNGVYYDIRISKKTFGDLRSGFISDDTASHESEL